MRHGPGEAIKLPNADDVEAPLVSIGHQPVKLRHGVFRTGDASVDVLAGDVPTSSLTVLSQLP
jgi:hypothetical protein